MIAKRQRIVLVGAGSFIAHHVRDAAVAEEFAVIGLPHNADIGAVIRADDVVINFGLTSQFKFEPYSEEQDFDLKVARLAHAAKAKFVALSTRKVYSADQLWGATESATCAGDGSFYGTNKAISERAIAAVVGPSLLVLRLSNIFGFELTQGAPRNTFFARMLSDLRAQNAACFDMAPQTRRDFLPVEHCASMVIAAIAGGGAGVFNVGCGFPIACGDMARWVMEGFGRGRLIVSNDAIRDEFFLDMTKWRETGLAHLITPDELRSYCLDLGRKLQLA